MTKEATVIARVVGIHEIALRADKVGQEEFERFVNEEFAEAFLSAMGAEVRLLKGVRGDRMGRYLVMLEFPTVEAFARFFPFGDGPATEEVGKALRDHQAAMDKYWRFVGSFPPTDYVDTRK